MDAWTRNGRETFTENVSLLKEAEAKAQPRRLKSSLVVSADGRW